MMKLAKKTITAESRMESHKAVNGIIPVFYFLRDPNSKKLMVERKKFKQTPNAQRRTPNAQFRGQGKMTNDEGPAFAKASAWQAGDEGEIS
jgi:hypothetical protein